VSKPRSPGQTLIGVAVDEHLLDAIDKNRGGLTRSAFVRNAIGKYLGISGDVLHAPDRTGKGGRPKKNLPQIVEGEPVAVPVLLAADDGTDDKARQRKLKKA
jgi:hypothetical protein